MKAPPSVPSGTGYSLFIVHCSFGAVGASCGGLAQLARAPALQAGGQRFESVILHQKRLSLTLALALSHEIFDMLGKTKSWKANPK